MIEIFKNATEAKSNIKLALLCGSARKGSLTRATAMWIKDYLLQQPGIEIVFVDPAKIPNHNFGGFFSKDVSTTLQDAVGKVDAIVCCTPEYHGSYSATLKLIIENLGYPSVMSGKPVALVGVAAGVIGAVKSLEHLRSLYGHLGSLVMPQVCSISEVHTVITGEGKVLNQKKMEQAKLAIEPLLTYLAAK